MDLANLYTMLPTIVVPLTILEKKETMSTLVAHRLAGSPHALSFEKRFVERLWFPCTFERHAQTSSLAPVRGVLQRAQ